MDTQWGDDVSEKFGGLVWLKSRNNAQAHQLFDTVRGVFHAIDSSTTGIENIYNGLNTFTSTGIKLGGNMSNTNAYTYASWNFQTTHRRTGVTNHGKAYTEHYNPFTGFTIIKYTGSGLVGHEIPHSLGRKLDIVVQKDLATASQWLVSTSYSSDMGLNVINAQDGVTRFTGDDKKITNVVLGTALANGSNKETILYGWANSYLYETNKLIGNYEVGVYQGTGVAGNKVTTRGKPAWIMLKRLNAVGDWVIFDNLRTPFGTNRLLPNLSAVEVTTTSVLTGLSDGFSLNTADAFSNASGGQYLYMVVYDSGSGKSKYPKATDTTNLTIDALVPYANGIDTNGEKVSIEYKNETITGLTLTEGKNYLYSKNDGTYDVSMIAPSYGIKNPLTGDFFNLKTLKWYDNNNAEITPRTYLGCVVYADHNGQVTYVEELQKVEYKDVIKANEYLGKNAILAYALIDMTATPPTILDSYNISSVTRISAGVGKATLRVPTDNDNVTAICSSNAGVGSVTATTKSEIHFATAVTSQTKTVVIVLGGKN